MMTIKEQLLQTIETLPDDLLAQTLQFVQTLQHPIHKTPGICGGAARIRDTRIPVWTIIAYQQQGATEVELLYNYPGAHPSRFASGCELLRTQPRRNRAVAC